MAYRDEIIGYDEILGPSVGEQVVGAESEIERLLAHASGYEVGAVVAMPPGALTYPTQGIAKYQGYRQTMAPGQVMLKNQPAQKAREFPIGFDSGALIAGGTSLNITSRPQILFRPERLLVPSDIAGDFTIDDVKVGNKSQLVASGSIPARVFQEDAVGVRLRGDTCQISQDLVLAVTNTAGAGRRFRACIIGTAVD
jgi:hypothetical protein